MRDFEESLNERRRRRTKACSRAEQVHQALALVDHDAIPALKMMRLTKEAIGQRAEAIAAQARSPKLNLEVTDGESVIGGGAAPSSVLPTRLLALNCDGLSADELSARLRASDPPVIARVEQGRVLLDLRTVFADQDSMIAAALDRIAS